MKSDFKNIDLGAYYRYYRDHRPILGVHEVVSFMKEYISLLDNIRASRSQKDLDIFYLDKEGFFVKMYEVFGLTRKLHFFTYCFSRELD